MKIKILSFLGFSLEEISVLLDAESKGSYEHMEAFFRNKLEETLFEIRQLQQIEGILQGACKKNQRNRVKVTGPIMYICHDEEYRETGADIEVALPVSGRISVEDPQMEVKTLPAIKAVSAVYRGPYPEVEAGYNRVISFSKEKNLEPFGPSRELYLNDPAEVPEEELMTEVQIQVRKK